MATTQSKDPNEKVEHPRHYNQHPSGIEAIELMEHLPCNLALAIKHIWRCGLKATETPIRDLKSAKWYIDREWQRIEAYELLDRSLKTDVVWRALARRVIKADEESFLSMFLTYLLNGNVKLCASVICFEIERLEKEAG